MLPNNEGDSHLDILFDMKLDWFIYIQFLII